MKGAELQSKYTQHARVAEQITHRSGRIHRPRGIQYRLVDLLCFSRLLLAPDVLSFTKHLIYQTRISPRVEALIKRRRLARNILHIHSSGTAFSSPSHKYNHSHCKQGPPQHPWQSSIFKSPQHNSNQQATMSTIVGSHSPSRWPSPKGNHGSGQPPNPQSRAGSSSSLPRSPPPSNTKTSEIHSGDGPKSPPPANPRGGGAQRENRFRAMATAKEPARSEELKALDNDALYITIDYREGGQNDFHWGLYHHASSEVGGTKFQIHGAWGKSWHADHGWTTGAMESTRLLALVRIKMPVTPVSTVVAILITAIDIDLSLRPNITSRIYVKEACERLKQYGSLRFNSWGELEAEIFAIGNGENRTVGEALQSGNSAKPRPVFISAVAK